MTEPQRGDWYTEYCRAMRAAKSGCCQAPLEDAGTCSEGCCDRWRCTKCGRTFTHEMPQ